MGARRHRARGRRVRGYGALAVRAEELRARSLDRGIQAFAFRLRPAGWHGVCSLPGKAWPPTRNVR